MTEGKKKPPSIHSCELDFWILNAISKFFLSSASCRNCEREKGRESERIGFHFRTLNIFRRFPFSGSTESKRPGDFLKACRSARTVSTVITTLCRHFSLYLPTYRVVSSRRFGSLSTLMWKYRSSRSLAPSLSAVLLFPRSESSETLFAVPSSRKLTVQPPEQLLLLSQLPSPSLLVPHPVCIRLLRKFRPVFVQ